jgi:polysaccharide export outer membrane protein
MKTAGLYWQSTRVLRFAALGLAAMLAACAGNDSHIGGAPGTTVVADNILPIPTKGDLTGQERPYLVGPFDRLTISVFGIEDFKDLEVQIDASGRMSFPLAGVMTVSGKTPGEIEGLLKDRLRLAYIKDPQVTVNLKDTLSQFVTVEGQVQKPGLYPVIGHMTLLRAIATAQGTTEFTKEKDIVVMRQVDGRQYAALYNLDAIRHAAYPDPDIYANDVVMVGDSKGRRFFKDFISIAGFALTPLVLLIKN